MSPSPFYRALPLCPLAPGLSRAGARGLGRKPGNDQTLGLHSAAFNADPRSSRLETVKATFALWCALCSLAGAPGFAAGEAQTAAGMPDYQLKELGPAMLSVNVRSAAFGTLPDGTAVVFALSNGEPLTFNVLDLRSGKNLHAESVIGETLGGSVHQARDGSVYFNVSQTTPGTLYRYSPNASPSLVRIGARIQNQTWLIDLDSSKDGTVFISTFPGAKLLSYDPNRGALHDFGSVAEDATYAYSVAIVEDEVWVGTGPLPHLVAVNRLSGAKREISFPPGQLDGVQYITKVQRRDRRVFVVLASGNQSGALVYDLKQNRWTDTLPAVGVSGFTQPDRQGNVYFVSKGRLLSYALESGSVRDVAADGAATSARTEGAPRTYGLGVVSIEGKEAVVGITNTGTLWRLFIEDARRNALLTEVRKTEAKIVGFGAGPDGKVYLGAKIGAGIIARIDPMTDTIEQLAGPSQAEGVGGLGDDILFGEYTGAVLHAGQLSRVWDWGRNPKPILKLGRGAPYHQDRIWAIEPAGDRFALGTIPEPGQNGGTLTFVQLPSGRSEVHRNVVPGQSVIALTHRDSMLYGSTAIQGGSGTPSEAKEACLFLWDLEKDRKVWEGAVLPGASTIGGLAWAPDGHLWGISEEGAVFEFDPDGRKIVRRRQVLAATHKHPWGHHSSLVYDPDHDGFWGTASQRTFFLDRTTLTPHLLPEKPVILRLVRTSGGAIYGVGETRVFRIVSVPRRTAKEAPARSPNSDSR